MHNDVQPAAMAHAHHQFDRALLSGRFEDFVHQRNERGHAFQRKALAAQIALLQDLLEKLGADQLIERASLVAPPIEGLPCAPGSSGAARDQ